MFQCEPDFLRNRLHEMRLKGMTPGLGGKFLDSVFSFWFLVFSGGRLAELQFYGILVIKCDVWCGGVGCGDGGGDLLSRWGTENGFFVRGGRGGRGVLQHLFVRGGRGGARSTSTPFLSTEDTEGRGVLQHLLSAEDAEDAEGRGVLQHLFVRGGRGEGLFVCGGRGRHFASDWDAGFELGQRERFLDGSGQLRRGYWWTQTRVASLGVVRSQAVEPVQSGKAQLKSHWASSMVRLTQPWLMGVPKLLCQ